MRSGSCLFAVQYWFFYMGERLVTIDLDKELTAAELEQAEDYANSQIWEDKPDHGQLFAAYGAVSASDA